MKHFIMIIGLVALTGCGATYSNPELNKAAYDRCQQYSSDCGEYYIR